MNGSPVYSTFTVEVDGVQVAAGPAGTGPDVERAVAIARAAASRHPGGVWTVWTHIRDEIYRTDAIGSRRHGRFVGWHT